MSAAAKNPRPVRSAASPSPRAEGTAVLAAARAALHALGLSPDELEIRGRPLVSGQSVIYVLAPPRKAPLYVAKVVTGGTAAAVAQHRALQTCHHWWREEALHHVARPLALMPACDGLLMEHVGGLSLSHLVRAALLRPARARRAARAAGDFLRRLHAHGRVADGEVDLAGLVAEIRAGEAANLAQAGPSLPTAVARTLDRVPPVKLAARRVLLHGDYAPRNLIAIAPDQVAMIDPLLAEEGAPEDDLASFLTHLSSASVFASGLVFPASRAVRLSLEQAFLGGYGPANFSPMICALRLILEQMSRWSYRRRAGRLGRGKLAAIRVALVDAQMAALLEESVAWLDEAIAARPVMGALAPPGSPLPRGP